MTDLSIPSPEAFANIQPGSLYPHQADGVSFLVSKKRALLADDMGLGKTRQAIFALQTAVPEGLILVICPASLKLNWAREIRKVEPDATIEIIGHGGASVGQPRWVIVNYDLLRREAERLHQIDWAAVILDEAHFIKNASARTTQCLKLLGVQNDARTAPLGPDYVFLLTGTPMTGRPRDLFNLLRCLGHPAARSFLSFARRYCDAYKNDFGWVTTGASNLDELNRLMKEVMLRRTKDEVLDLPPKVRTWVPVDITGSAAALAAIESFLDWYQSTDPNRPNDTLFLARLSKVRLALHKAKHKAVSERIADVVTDGRKVVVFNCFNEGVSKHAEVWGSAAVMITGAQNTTQRMAAVDRFQDDPSVKVAVCNIIAGGVGITLTAGTHVIFQDLDWVPANHAQAEDRCYRLGQMERVTVEYFHADGTLDAYIARLLATKITLIEAVQSEHEPDVSIMSELATNLRTLAPAMIEEVRLMRAGVSRHLEDRIGHLTASWPRQERRDTALEATGSWEFQSERDASHHYRVTFGRAGHLECTCKGFEYRGNCKHVQSVRREMS